MARSRRNNSEKEAPVARSRRNISGKGTPVAGSRRNNSGKEASEGRSRRNISGKKAPGAEFWRQIWAAEAGLEGSEMQDCLRDGPLAKSGHGNERPPSLGPECSGPLP